MPLKPWGHWAAYSMVFAGLELAVSTNMITRSKKIKIKKRERRR